MEAIADSGGGRSPPTEQRLCPEPERQRDSRHSQPREQAAPAVCAFGSCHEIFSTGRNSSKLFAERTLRHLQRQFTGLPEIEFSSPEIREVLDTQKLIVAGAPRSRQIALSEFFQALRQLLFIQGMEHNEALAFFLIGNRRHHKGL